MNELKNILQIQKIALNTPIPGQLGIIFLKGLFVGPYLIVPNKSRSELYLPRGPACSGFS